MRYFIDAYGFVGQSLIYQLITQFRVDPSSLLVNTYLRSDNQLLLAFLNENSISYTTLPYSDPQLYSRFCDFSPDYLFSFYARRIIPDSYITRTSKLTLNLHPSLLPKYRGCFSAPWALINGESTTGISFHSLTSCVDCGFLYYQEELSILPSDTAFTLWNRLAQAFIVSFPHVFSSITAHPSRSDYPVLTDSYSAYPRKLPYDGLIDPTWHPTFIERFIRAMFYPPFPPAQLRLEDGQLANIYSYEQFLDFQL